MPERTVSVGLVADVSNYIAGMRKARGETDDLGKTAVTAGERTRGFVSKIGGSLSSLGNQVGGTVGNILSTVGADMDELAGKAAKLSTGLELGGGAAIAAAAGLEELGSSAVKATAELKTAVGNAGDDYGSYADQIEKLIAKNQNLNFSTEDTQAALTKLIPAAGSTKAALAQMGVVTDLAAAKHEDLATAATSVATILGGGTGRALKQYGIQLQALPNQVTATASATKGLEKAQETLGAAQERLTQLTDIDRQKKSLTIGQQFALKNAQDAVTKATQGVTDAQSKLSFAQNIGVQRTKNANDALDQLGKKLAGQPTAAVSNFAGQFDVAKTHVEDFIKEAATPAGEVLGAVGAAAQVAGVALDVHAAIQAKNAAATAAATAAQEAQTIALGEAVGATEAETGAMTTLDGAMDANPIGAVTLALGGLALIAGGTLLSEQQALSDSTDSYTAALNKNTGSLNANVRAATTKQLSDSGALAAARTLGISQSDAVSAAEGNVKALARVRSELEKYRGDAAIANSENGTLFAGMDKNGVAANTLFQTINTSSLGLKAAKQKQEDYNAGLDATTKSAHAATQKIDALHTALNNLKGQANVQVTVTGKHVPTSFTGGAVIGGRVAQHFATGGGVFRGPGTGTSDSIPAMVSNGEYINTAATVARLGVGFFQGLNRGGSPEKYQSAPSVSNVDARQLNISLDMSGIAASSKAEFGQLAVQAIREGIKNGTVSKDWVNRA